MASPVAFLRRNRGAALTAAGAGAAVIGYAALRHARPIEAMPPGSSATAAGAAATPAADPSSAIAQGASIALQGAGLGLGVAQGGLDLAGLATTAAAGIAETLAGSQEAMGQTLGQVAESAIGILPSLAPAAGYPAQPVTAPLPPTPMPAPAPTPTPAPAPTFLRYEVAITGAGTVRGYIVGSGCTLSARFLTFSRASYAPVARSVCNGRVTWKTLAGGYSGVSYVAGLSTGPWTVRKVSRSASGALTYQTIGQTGS